MAASPEPLSLLGLEEELTCSICLSPFDCPVSTPCGHNFCQECLFATWKDSFSCPQCRTIFPTKPELKKNTVLTAVVEALNLKISGCGAPSLLGEKKKKSVIRCDTCMEAEAAQTCLTCMASFCEEHLRPHRENPIYSPHQLSEPVGDLLERICPDHHKLMEHFCSQHARLICSLCLQQTHRGCSFMSPEEQRNQKESELRGQLGLLEGKITKNEAVVSQMMAVQTKLKDSATSRKNMVAAEYQQIRELLALEERDALNSVDREVETGQAKIKNLVKKFTKNIEDMSKAKDEIRSLLSQSQTMTFLQAAPKLPEAVNFDPFTPQINLDSKKVKAAQAFAATLKEDLTEIFKQPVEARPPLLRKPAERPSFSPGFGSESVRGNLPEPQWFQCNPRVPQPVNTGPQPKPQKKTQKKTPKKPVQLPDESLANDALNHSRESLYEFGVQLPPTRPKCSPEPVDMSPNITSAEKRTELLKYGTVLTLDPRTAHKRISLSEGFTKASVSDEHANYPDCPQRFTVCSQVLTTKGFSRGRHYWEVRMSSNNFIGIGLAYGSIDRKGPASRLGRNAQSWCIEWFNVKLSAWHNSSEKVLVNPNPKRVGVLLDCEEGMATFYNVADRAYPFHSFVFPFAEAVYPAFWIFSSGSSISLCKLQA
ncbi:E3 ubiquitin/ISG15 ligase TRIM25-like isoform X2 [Parambassis ranga]|uniref:RING-type E3 ubiquitin transferase n=1 Tax=Parambassis ranga TaxID=210632 RepID=A0A6P7HUA8_9TELE|nr:E3 ubiquitin/ISG15 ligase TRIM25-like isoform X2 [Parambassis ranga]